MSYPKSKIALILSMTAVLMVGCAASPTHESTGQYLDSAVITAKVKSNLLKDSALSAFQIDVTTYKDTVQLSGFVDSQKEKDAAAQAARIVPGVREVENDLIVKSST